MTSSTFAQVTAAAAIAAGAFSVTTPVSAVRQEVLTVDHYVRVRSSVPAITGQISQIYVRERATPATTLRGAPSSGRVVLFVHGAGTPAEVAFDAPYAGYSWMEFLATAGYDVFAMDLTGYGRSTRPNVMNDPCNLSADQQQTLMPAVLQSPCPATYPYQLTTIASDWDDIDAVVDYVRALRRVDRVSLIGWSLGAPRSGGYASAHPEKVEKLVLLAPAYNRNAETAAPAKLPAAGVPFNKQSRDDFSANWDRQVGCADQYEPAVRDAVWRAMLESDPVGATWGPGVRRAPSVTVWGWNAGTAARLKIPTLLVAGVHDKQVLPERVRELHADLGSPQKVFVDLACASHNALWERNRALLFGASLEWLTRGTVNGAKDGTVRLGY